MGCQVYSYFFIKGILCLFEVGTFFTSSWQDWIPLETNLIEAKAGQHSSCKYFVLGRFWKKAYSAYHVIKSIH